MKSKSSRHFIIFIVFCLFFVAVLTVSFLSAILTFSQRGRMAYGLEFEGTPLTGMTQENAARLFERAAQQKLSRNAVLLSYEQHSWSITAQEIGLTADIAATVQEAYAIGRSGSLLQNLCDNIRCALNGRSVRLITHYDEATLQFALDAIAARIDRPAEDAACFFGPNGQIQRQPAVIGRKVDTRALAEHFRPQLLALSLPQRATIEPDKEYPPISDEDLAAIDSVLASYTTFFGEGGNRGENIHIAAEALSQSFIPAGEEFSFNDAVGGRVASAGYLNAPVIINGKVEQDIGGGVCQVSSTLYNAILLAGLTPTERTAHFYPSSYVPAGLDATVADGQIDFCFRNDLPHNVYLLTSTADGALTIYVLGTRADLENDDIRLETAIEGPGPTVSAWRIYSRYGQELTREHLHTETYDTPE